MNNPPPTKMNEMKSYKRMYNTNHNGRKSLTYILLNDALKSSLKPVTGGSDASLAEVACLALGHTLLALGSHAHG